MFVSIPLCDDYVTALQYVRVREASMKGTIFQLCFDFLTPSPASFFPT